MSDTAEDVESMEAKKEKSLYDKLNSTLKSTLIRWILMNCPEMVTDQGLRVAKLHEDHDELTSQISDVRELLQDRSKKTGTDINEQTLEALDAAEKAHENAVNAVEEQLDLFGGSVTPIDSAKH